MLVFEGKFALLIFFKNAERLEIVLQHDRTDTLVFQKLVDSELDESKFIADAAIVTAAT